MILVDSSVWIDLLGDRQTPQTRRFEQLLAEEQPVGVADLVAAEVLQGTRSERNFQDALATLRAFPWVRVVDGEVAVNAARNFRTLRSRGITVRKTAATLIATRCIIDRIPLLYGDRDFDPFVAHLQLRSALNDTGAT
jgi:hypothetical protein